MPAAGLTPEALHAMLPTRLGEVNAQRKQYTDAQLRVDAMRRMLRTRGEHDDADLDLLGDASAFEGVAKFPMRVKCAMRRCPREARWSRASRAPSSSSPTTVS